MSSRNNFSISVCFALFSFQGTPEFAKGKLGEIFLDSLRSSFRFAKPENSRPALLNFPLCCQSPLSCTFRCWWVAFLESLSAVGLYFRLSARFLCLSKLAPHLSVLVGLSGLEPPTSRLSGVRSNRLSYKPISWFERCTYHSALVEMNGFEPMTPCLQSRCSPS